MGPYIFLCNKNETSEQKLMKHTSPWWIEPTIVDPWHFVLFLMVMPELYWNSLHYIKY